jgi:pilus assembly protein CpaE
MMGTPKHFNFHGKGSDVRSCADVLIVASPQTLAAADLLTDSEVFPGLVIQPCENTEAVSLDTAKAASLVVLEIDPHSRASMQRLHDLKLAQPDLPVVAAIADTSVNLVRALVREGIADVVALPFQFEEVLETTANVLTSMRRRNAQEVSLAPMIAVVRSIGGCGATSVATHLVAELGRHAGAGERVAIVDLDLQFGNVSTFLSGEGRGSIGDLLEAEDRLDDLLITSAARHFGENVDIFAAPEEITPIESVDTDALLLVLDKLRRKYAFVVLDLPSNWTNWTLSAVAACERIVMVVELSIASLRQARRRLDLFASVGIEGNRVDIVVNRVARRLFRAIDLGDVEQTLGHTVLGSIAFEDATVTGAQNQGQLTGQIHRKSRFASDVAKLSDELVQRLGSGVRT